MAAVADQRPALNDACALRTRSLACPGFGFALALAVSLVDAARLASAGARFALGSAPVSVTRPSAASPSRRSRCTLVLTDGARLPRYSARTFFVRS